MDQDSDEEDRITDLEEIKINNIENNIEEDNEVDNMDEKDFEEKIKREKFFEIKKILKESKKPLTIWKYKTKENDDSTILHCSVFYNHTKIIKEIIKYCKKHLTDKEFKDFINKQNKNGITALHYASFRGNVDILNYLEFYGADMNVVTNKNLNVIHFACQGNKPNSLVYFDNCCKTKFYFNEIDSKKSTPLHWACFMSAFECINFLLNKKVGINIKDIDGNTPLHLAVIGGVSKIVRLLLQKGAVTNIKNNKMLTPLQLAIDKKRIEISNILKSNSKCAVCNCKAPTKKISKSKKYIFIAIIFKLLVYFILFFNIYPYLYKTCNEYIYLIINLISLAFFLIIEFLFIILYFYLICSNPGYITNLDVDNNYETLLFKKKNDFKNYCFKCCVQTTDNLKHCAICDKCCKEFDHHCFWVNNCIGMNNYMKFISFLYINFFDFLLMLSTSVYTLLITFELFFKKKNNGDKCHTFDNIKILKIIYDFVKKYIFFFEINYNKLLPTNPIPYINYLDYFQILIIILLIINITALIPLIYLVHLHTGLCLKKRKEKNILRKDVRSKIDTLEEDSLIQSEGDTSLDSIFLMRKSLLQN